MLTDRPEDKENNVLFSPSSILTGIGMLFRGMEGQTRENVRRIMGFPSKDNPKIFRDAFKVCSYKMVSIAKEKVEILLHYNSFYFLCNQLSISSETNKELINTR